MKSGVKKVKKDHRDYSHNKFRKYGAARPVSYEEFNFDAGLTMPNQEAPYTYGSYIVPAWPFGCTNYTQTDICTDEDGAINNPLLMEEATKANAKGGEDIRASLAAAVHVFGRQAYYAVESSGQLDWFDAIYLAMYSTLHDERRSVSVATPWFGAFETVPHGILPASISYNVQEASWHNWKICGLKYINGISYLIGKTWQGDAFDFIYVSRETINVLLNISGTGAFVLDKLMPGEPQTIDMNYLQKLISIIKQLFSNVFTPAEVPAAPNSALEAPVESVNTKPAITTAMKLYEAAKANLGKQLAPDSIEEVGCAYSVDVCWKDATGNYMDSKAPTVNTGVMYRLMDSDARFRRRAPTETPEPGDIVIAPTGYGNGTIPHGHVAIVAKYGMMSNDSLARKFLENYSYSHFVHYFHVLGGYPVAVFEPL